MCPGSHDLNFSNRPVRTRMPGGVGGARSAKLTAPIPIWDQCCLALFIHASYLINSDRNRFEIELAEEYGKWRILGLHWKRIDPAVL